MWNNHLTRTSRFCAAKGTFTIPPWKNITQREISEPIVDQVDIVGDLFVKTDYGRQLT
jgi:hypothetical protein